ncbi:uncharacterized protein LOC113227995 [Hyposmocoma kahamanoa]|uniref:uncharacterized protein LOC113227995 n=1 Tax=Hyposmocoma kahamanoa TaxID=1477025 RepID=UPI000E6D9641|nr:uncharacterized protein LOC113227995 [Hyposmocoma kahamanoa]
MQILRQDDNMETSSYLFTSKRKKLIKPLQKMERRSSSDSSISADSLELGRRKKAVEKQKPSDENVETILVPFYENDVLIKVPKSYKKNQNAKSEKQKKDTQPNYLVNKNKIKRATYLEMFRRQFSPVRAKESAYDECEVNSLLPEYGDTERESIEEEHNDDNISVNDYYNTESYNELFYEKILQQDAAVYLDNSLEQALLFKADIRSKSSDDADDNNLKGLSEVEPVRRRSRTATVQPVLHVKLTGLGPDLEKIKPRLERARSLQRYSEKVRMENRLKIYKAKVQADEKKNEEEVSSAKRSVNVVKVRHVSPSYLVNKGEEKKNILTRKIYQSQSKSANVHKNRNECKEKEYVEVDRTRNKIGDNLNKERVSRAKINFKKVLDKNREKDLKQAETKGQRFKVLSGKNVQRDTTEDKTAAVSVPPVQISFLVNVGGVRPSSALRRLEEKHRMYQERVKAFKNNNNT